MRVFPLFPQTQRVKRRKRGDDEDADDDELPCENYVVGKMSDEPKREGDRSF